MYADELVRVSIQWVPEGATAWAGEQAVTTFHLRHHHFVGNSFNWPVEVAALPTQLHDKLVTHWSGIASYVSSEAFIRQIKCAHLDASGHTIDEGALDVTDSSLQGGGTAGMLPPEVAICVSQWAYTPGGFAPAKGRKRGRFYLPYIAKGVPGSFGTLESGDRTALATALQSLFNDIQGMHTTDEDPVPPNLDPDYWDFVVASGVDGTWHNVDWVSVDSHFDSQRRRQHQSVADRTALAISHA